jgi:hypothetical protein
MTGRKLAGLMVAAGLLAVGVPAAQAAPQAGGGCQTDQWTVATIAATGTATYEILLDKVTYPTEESWTAVVAQQDKNGDGYLCYSIGNFNKGHGGIRFVYEDNKFQRRSF